MTDPVSPLLLYVEDDPLIRETMVESLEEAGFELLVADSGDRAVELLVAHAADLRGLITDVNLGDGPDGWAIAKEARQLMAGLPVVYVSGASDHEWTSEGVPGSTIIAKPFASTQLVVAISALLVVSDH
ncbi:response regulator [Sphingomonas asaccharolytica]|uniref:response regulator n=1 Tax=Sphingomonas asaccharolytica TaxID=40681 RepID=UPI000836AC82|nr:response regulator [Sphingomonas asaccharolytica]